MREGEPVKPRPPTWMEYLQHQVDIYVARLRNPNDPDVARLAAEAVVYREEAQKAAASVIPVRHPHFGECLIVTPKVGKSLLATFQKLLPSVTFVKRAAEDTRTPSSLTPFIKAMRKGD
jgi:hypothetical protein